MNDDIYIIESPNKKWRAEISARLGANVTKLQYDGMDVFIPLKSDEQLENDPFIIGCPLLFPANRTYKGEFEFQGNKYILPINDKFKVSHLHGFLYCQEFDLMEISPQRTVLSYKNKGEIYPFEFKITVDYSLDDNGLKQNYTIKNIGNKDMPFTFALHATFKEPEYFKVPINLCQEKDEKHIPSGKYIELNEQESLYCLGSKSKDKVISGYYKSCGNIAIIGDYKYTISENFDHWVLYNGQGKSGLLCIEPQCGAVDGLNIPKGHKVLDPDGEEMFYTKISKKSESEK